MINVLVTGSNGFVGKNLLKKSNEYIKFHPIELNKIILKDTQSHSSFSVDHIIHLAAKTYVPESWVNPHDFYQVNVMGTQSVLDLCNHLKCSLTYVSSYVYGIPEYLPIDENHKLAPNTPYNHSKLMGEDLCRFYNRIFDVNIAILRPFNIYGINQSNQFLIPKIIEQVLFDNKISLESLTPKRDFLFIDDFIDLLISTINCEGCEVYNVGYGKSYSVKEIVDLVIKLSGKQNINIESKNTIRNNEVMDVVANITKSKEKLNWSPQVTLTNGLLQIIDFYGKEKTN